jgi:membrane fusion protein (multidrug efflux system)
MLLAPRMTPRRPISPGARSIARSGESHEGAQANIKQAEGRCVRYPSRRARAEAQSRLAHAQVQTAQAALQSAQLSLSYTRIVAPSDGLASRLSVHPGSYVTRPADHAARPRTTYIVANFKET